MGIAGGGIAVVITTALSTAAHGLVHLVRAQRRAAQARPRLRKVLFVDILRVGAVGSVSTLQTTLVFMLTTALVGAAGGPDAVAGYGTGARLEYLLIPLVFGLGAPLVALVGTNIGAGQQARALRIALTGGAIAFALTEAIGLAAAIWPKPGSVCSATTRRCSKPAAPTCASSGRPTVSSASACRCISPRRVRAGCSGLCSAASSGSSLRSAAAGSCCG